MESPDRFAAHYQDLEARHLSELTFSEVRRALQALSSLYVERRERMADGAALDGAGKRAAFALYYGPMHFLLVGEIVRALGARAPRRLLDLGCGTGTAWALEGQPAARVEGVDRSGWAVGEARWTYARLGLDGRATRTDAATAPLPKPPAGILAAFTVNELGDGPRGELLPRLLGAARAGSTILVVEPIARRMSPRVAGVGGGVPRRRGPRGRVALPPRAATTPRPRREGRLSRRARADRTVAVPPIGLMIPGEEAPLPEPASVNRRSFLETSAAPQDFSKAPRHANQRAFGRRSPECSGDCPRGRR